MNKSLFSMVFMFITINIIAQNPNPSSIVDSSILQIMNEEHLPGVSTVIIRDGEIVWIKSYGYANTDFAAPYNDTTSQMIASVSKVFTGLSIMQLYENGLLELDDNINDYLPFDIDIPNFETNPITFRMLLTHTSSIKDGDAVDNYYNWNGDPTISLADCIERYFLPTGEDYSSTDNFLNSQPGAVYEYSNMATALEGYLVERISGIPFNQYCNQNIFIPLGMNNTHWYLSEYSNSNMLANPHYYYDSQFVPIDNYGFADYPDGMLHTNVKDLANFMIAIFQSGVFNNNTILSPETLSDMFTSQIPAIEPTQGLQFYQETFNVSTGNVTLWGHSGGEYGISTEMYFDFTENMGIAVLANGENGTRHIFEELYDYGLTLSPSGAPNLGKESDTQKKIVLNDVFPNPFNSSAQISYSLPKNAFVRLRIFDLLGREIVTLVNQKQPSGNYTVKFDASKLSSGIYFCRLRVADFAVTKKIILLR